MCIHACLLPHSLGITLHRVHGLFHCRMCVRLIVQQIDKLLHMQYICTYVYCISSIPGDCQTCLP